MAAPPRFVLVSNDDGPPNTHDSPFIAPFIKALDNVGWNRGVCLPARQASWIGKAHLVREVVVKTQYDHSDTDQWWLLDAPPAGCVNVGLFHLFKEQQPDLILSGPNYGRNTGTAFASSSGTIGGALEGALCNVRSIALSFGYTRDEPFSEADVAAACTTAMQVVSRLWSSWPSGVHLFTVNIPLYTNINHNPKVFTTSFHHSNYRSLYAVSDENSFVFKPDYSALLSHEDDAAEGTDVWALKHKFVSVTPLLASWTEAPAHLPLVFPRFSASLNELETAQKEVTFL